MSASSESDVRDPLVELEAMRSSCKDAAGRSPVLAAIAHCCRHGLALPDWLQGAYLRGYEHVVGAHVATWDEAFGRWWPAHTRLGSERVKIAQRKLVHTAVCEAVLADAERPIDTILFEEIGERPGINRCASVVAERYYEAIHAGAWNPAALRRGRP